jgi:hypothetical protein
VPSLSSFPDMVYNERSLYMLPGDSRRLALLLRGAYANPNTHTHTHTLYIYTYEERLNSARFYPGRLRTNVMILHPDWFSICLFVCF